MAEVYPIQVGASRAIPPDGGNLQPQAGPFSSSDGTQYVFAFTQWNSGAPAVVPFELRSDPGGIPSSVGAYRTLDGGVTWQRADAANDRHLVSLNFDDTPPPGYDNWAYSGRTFWCARSPGSPLVYVAYAGTAGTISISAFDLETGTWGPEYSSAVALQFATAADVTILPNAFACIEIESTTGQVIIAYDSQSSGEPQRTRSFRFNPATGTFTSPSYLSATGSYTLVSLVAGTGGRVYACVYTGDGDAAMSLVADGSGGSVPGIELIPGWDNSYPETVQSIASSQGIIYLLGQLDDSKLYWATGDATLSWNSVPTPTGIYQTFVLIPQTSGMVAVNAVLGLGEPLNYFDVTGGVIGPNTELLPGSAGPFNAISGNLTGSFSVIFAPSVITTIPGYPSAYSFATTSSPAVGSTLPVSLTNYKPLLKEPNIYDCCLDAFHLWTRSLDWRRKPRCEMVEMPGGYLMPAQGREFTAKNSILTPEPATLDNLVVRVRVPTGYNGILYALCLFYAGTGFVEGSGDLYYRLKVGRAWARNLGNWAYSLGVPNQPFPLSDQIWLEDGQSVELYVSAPNLSGSLQIGIARIIGVLQGWFYPA